MIMMPVTSKAAEPKKETTSTTMQKEGKEKGSVLILFKKILNFAIIWAISVVIHAFFAIIGLKKKAIAGAIVGSIIGLIEQYVYFVWIEANEAGKEAFSAPTLYYVIMGSVLGSIVQLYLLSFLEDGMNVLIRSMAFWGVMGVILGSILLLAEYVSKKGSVAN